MFSIACIYKLAHMQKMTTDTNIKLGNVTRQCEYLKTKGDEIARTSSWVLWSWDKSDYFMKLRDYCKFHKEIKDFLTTHYTDNDLILVRVKQLPDIDFKDYSGEQMGWRTAVTGILLYIFFPLAYLWMYRAIRYINRTRQQIYQAGGLYSSIAFLLKAQTN